MKVFLIILIILLILFLLWWFFCRKKKCCKKEEYEKAEAAPARSAKPAGPETAANYDAFDVVEEFKANENGEVYIKPAKPEKAAEPVKAAEPEKAAAPVKAAEPEKAVEFKAFEASETVNGPVKAAAPEKKAFFSFSDCTAAGFGNLNGYRRVIAINVETPNSDNDRICNIGISVGDGSGIRSSALRINPEVQLDDVPDGLTADDILNAPTFPQLWPELSALFEGSLVLAHNTAHDLNILKKVLKAYGLSAPDFDYACTYRTTRKFHPDYENHKLGTVCNIYGIPLDVRDAVSHSEACLEIFRHLVAEGQPFFAEAKKFTVEG